MAFIASLFIKFMIHFKNSILGYILRTVYASVIADFSTTVDCSVNQFQLYYL